MIQFPRRRPRSTIRTSVRPQHDFGGDRAASARRYAKTTAELTTPLQPRVFLLDPQPGA